MHKIVSLNKIDLADGHPGMSRQARRGGRSGVGPYSGEIVLLKEGDRYKLYFGSAKLQVAINANHRSAKAVVHEEMDELTRHELLLLENYCSATKSAVEIASLFVEHRKKFDLSQHEFSKRVKIAPGTIHHYESLILSLSPKLARMVQEGKLRFKEARCIADLKPHSRQLEIAKPFLDNKVSSVHVEQVIKIAKREPRMGVDTIVDKVLNGAKASATKTVKAPYTEKRSLELQILSVAGELAQLVFNPPSEIQRLQLISGLRVLDSRLKIALNYLHKPVETGPAVALDYRTVPPPSKR